MCIPSVAYVVLHMTKRKTPEKKKQKKEININKGKTFLVYTGKAYVYTKKNKKIIDLKTALIEI